MSAKWPPKGHSFTYKMTVESDALNFTAETTFPSGRVTDIATFRWDRLGGPQDEDLAFREELYRAVGAVTVAGGHAESAMKRVLIVMEGKDRFSDVELPWGRIVDRLRRASTTNHALAQRLEEVLDWAANRKVKERRDNVVHASWIEFPDLEVTGSRFTRDGESYSLTTSFEILKADAEVIVEFASRLDDLVESEWPQARLLQKSGPAIPSTFLNSK